MASGEVEVIFDIVRDGWTVNPSTSLITSAPLAGLALVLLGPVLRLLISRWPALAFLRELSERKRMLWGLGAVFIAAGPVIYFALKNDFDAKAARIESGDCTWVEGKLSKVGANDMAPYFTRYVWEIGGRTLKFDTVTMHGYTPASRRLTQIHEGDHLRLCVIDRDVWRVERVNS